MILEALIPPAKPGGRPRSVEMRRILNGIFYMLRTGCPWRFLPRNYPPWPTVSHYFRVFRNAHGLRNEMYSSMKWLWITLCVAFVSRQ